MNDFPPDNGSERSTEQDLPEIELTDEDILDAMQHIPGYLDISTEDFRAIYHLAHRHAVKRLFEGIRAYRLMRTGVRPLPPDMPLIDAAEAIARSGHKGLPVVDAAGRVLGMLTEADFLRRLQAGTFLDFLLKLLDDKGAFTHRCHETLVGEAMTSPAVTVAEDAGLGVILRAFRQHGGRCMPVVAGDGQYRGLLSRKDILAAHHLEGLL